MPGILMTALLSDHGTGSGGKHAVFQCINIDAYNSERYMLIVLVRLIIQLL